MNTLEDFNMPEKIRMLCGKRNFSLADLAEKTGQSKQNLSNKMLRTDWKLSEIKRVFDALGAELQLQIIDKETGKPFTI